MIEALGRMKRLVIYILDHGNRDNIKLRILYIGMVIGSTNSAFIAQEYHMSFKPILTLDKDKINRSLEEHTIALEAK